MMKTNALIVDAAKIVKAIRKGKWIDEPPTWANVPRYECLNSDPSSYVRAVQTAEAFVILFTNWNPRFDTKRFLKACGF